MKDVLQNDITISYLDSIRLGNGSKSTFVEDIEDVRQKAIGKTKDKSPCLLAYNGVRGTYTPSNAFFIDIDTDYKVDYIIENRDKLFSRCQNIVFLQKSSSGNLHIVGTHGTVIEDSDEWNVATAYQTAFINESISQEFNINYVEHKNSKGQSSLDGHNTKWTQVFYVSDNTIYKNDFVNPVIIGKKDEGKLKEKYKDVFNFTVPKKYKTIQYKNDLINIVDEEYKGEKILVNTELVDKYFSNKFNTDGTKWTGNDLRWRISIIAFNHFGEDEYKAKSWCDERFYYDKGRSIFSIPSDESRRNNNPLVEKWLEEIGLFKLNNTVEENENTKVVEIPDEYWLSDLNKITLDTVEKYNSVSITAPTGAGKTTALINIALMCENRRTVLDNQFESEKVDAFDSKLYREPLILVPFNATNNLYSDLNIISSENKNKEYKENQTNVMVWDQYVKYADRINPDVIFIDESHTLVVDQRYRNSAISTIAKLKEKQEEGNTKLVFISATPSFEQIIFNTFNLVYVKKDNRNINIQFVKTYETSDKDDKKCSIIGGMLQDIYFSKRDRVCVFSNRDTKKLYYHLLSKDKISKIYHTEFPDNLKQLTDGEGEDKKNKEMLVERINLFTCIAYNGLNIRNENEKILIIFRFTPGENTWNELLQIIGRFRKAKDILVKVYFNDEECDVEAEREIIIDRFHNAKVICESNSLELKNDYWERMNVEEVQNAILSVFDYVSSQNVEYLKEAACKCGFKIKNVEVKENFCISKVNPIKKEQSDRFKKFLAGENVQINEDDEFIEVWKSLMSKISQRYLVDVNKIITERLFVDKKQFEVVKDKDGNTVKTKKSNKDKKRVVKDENGKVVLKKCIVTKMMDGILNDIERVLYINSISEETWKEEKLKRDKILNDVTPNLRASIQRKFDKDDEYREKYANVHYTCALDLYVDDLFVEFLELAGKRSEGGKKGGKASKKVKDTVTGKTFDSLQDAAKYFNKNVDTMSRWLKKNRLVENTDLIGFE